jgi:hypothetical protein
LAPREEEVSLCEEFINDFCYPRKYISRKWTSYGLKHLVERHLDRHGQHAYISNGAFILAAIRRGYRWKIHPSGLNLFFNMEILPEGRPDVIGGKS